MLLPTFSQYTMLSSISAVPLVALPSPNILSTKELGSMLEAWLMLNTKEFASLLTFERVLKDHITFRDTYW